MLDSPYALIESTISRGEQLAESKWKALVEELDGMERSHTAIVLENAARWLSTMDETVRAVNVGNFDRYAFTLIRAVFPNLQAHNWVSVQPLEGPVGLIFYFDLIYGSNKGAIKAGTPVFSSLTGHPGDSSYSGPEIRDEARHTGTGVATSFNSTADYTPVVRSSFEISDGTLTARDDGAGNLVGDGTGTINYATGVYSVTFATAPASGNSIVLNYEYDNEANSQVPEIDFQLTSAPVVPKIYKLRTRYSLEAAQNLKNLHGLSAETELVTALAQELRFETDRIILKDVNSIAQATSVSWPLTPSAGVSYTEHKLSIVDKFIEGSNNIYELTRRGHPNWIAAGLKVMNVIESLPGFKPSGQMSAPVGVIYAGDLNGRWRIYKDPYNIDGTTTQRNLLIGYKGATFLEAGYVYAPYIPFYTTPTVILDDFIARKGMASSWGKRKVNGRFFCKGTVTGSFAA